jgi:hypothetical protein
VTLYRYNIICIHQENNFSKLKNFMIKTGKW